MTVKELKEKKQEILDLCNLPAPGGPGYLPTDSKRFIVEVQPMYTDYIYFAIVKGSYYGSVIVGDDDTMTEGTVAWRYVIGIYDSEENPEYFI